MQGVFSLTLYAEQKIPLPCQQSIESYLKNPSNQVPPSPQLNRCSALFDQCEITNVATQSPGIGPELIDELIRATIHERIHNLYLGIDSFSKKETLTSPQRIRGTDIVSANTQGFGPCHTVGACNPYCQEGSPPINLQFQMSQIAPVVQSGSLSSAPQLGGHGFLPNRSQLLFNSLSPYLNTNALIVKKKDFWAKGVLGGTNITPPSDSEILPEAAYRPFLNSGQNPSFFQSPGLTAAGWPTQYFFPTPRNLDQGPKQCRTGSPPDQPPMSRHVGFYPHLTKQLGLRSYQLKTMSWNDGSFPQSGFSSCHITHAMDFSQASTMAALQTGALVQATWMALQEVTDELQSNRYQLNVQYPQCQAMIPTYLNDFNTVAETLFQVTSQCIVPLNDIQGGCCAYLKNKKETELGTNQALTELICSTYIATGNRRSSDVFHQSDCHKLAYLYQFRSMSFLNIAKCEILMRAQDRFQKAFESPLSQQWLAQIKSQAVLGCLQNQGGFLEREYKTTQGDCLYLITVCPSILAAAALTFGILAGPTAFLLPICTTLGAILADNDRCISDDSYSTLDKAIARDFPLKALGNCFPYAYATSFKSYLDTLGFQSVPLQRNYQSKKKSKDQKSLIEVNDCQLIERQPSIQSLKPLSVRSDNLPQLDFNVKKPLLPLFGFLFQRTRRRTQRRCFRAQFKAMKLILIIFIFSIFSIQALDLQDLRMQSISINYCISPQGVLMVGQQLGCCDFQNQNHQGLSTARFEGNSLECQKNSDANNSIFENYASGQKLLKSSGASLIALNSKNTSYQPGTPSNQSGMDFSKASQAKEQQVPIEFQVAQQINDPSALERIESSSIDSNPSQQLNSTSSVKTARTTEDTLASPSPSPQTSLNPQISDALYSASLGQIEIARGNPSTRSLEVLTTTTHPSQEVNFNEKNSSQKILEIEDPEDYFTRINLEDDLFKIIHRRYQSKAPFFI